MSRLVLVRHGHAAAGWGAGPDPGLDDVGRAQAEVMADALAPLGPVPVLASPLRRTRETAAALERRWETTAAVDPGVGEIESPSSALAERDAWLRAVMQGCWSDAPELARWRQLVIDTLANIRADTVVVTHFIAINVVVGHATNDDRVVCFMPENCSRTIIDVDGLDFDVVELGEQAATTRVQ